MKLNLKNNLKLNTYIKRPISNTSSNTKKLNIIPIFVQKTKKIQNNSK